MLLDDVVTALKSISLLQTLAIPLFVYTIWSCISSWYRLRHFPGPFLGAVSSLWLVKVWVSNQQGKGYENVNREYNSRLVRVGPNDLMTDDPDIIRHMNGVRSGYSRSNWYYPSRIDPYQRGLFNHTDNAVHDKLRAKVAHGFQGKMNISMEADVDQQVHELIQLIKSKYISKGDGPFKPIDMAMSVAYFTLDSFTKIAYGKPFGFLTTDSDVYSYIQTLEESVPPVVLASDLPLLGSIMFSPWILKLIGPKTTDKKGAGVILRLAKEVVAERFDNPEAKPKNDMLGAFIKAGCTQGECQTEVPFQLIAGSDTTATAIRATLLQLAANRQAYAKLQKEIDTAISDGRISSPITAEEGKHLEYLQAVIYEGLRMQVPFTGLLSKEVPPQGDTINGQFIPGGTRIGHNSCGMQLRADIFGEDVDVFRPERWLVADPARKAKMVQTTELVFGYGRWQCLGKSIAFMEMVKVYVEVCLSTLENISVFFGGMCELTKDLNRTVTATV